jgi:hypothetical protein
MTDDMEIDDDGGICAKTGGDVEDGGVGVERACSPGRWVKEVRIVSCSIKTDVPARYLDKFFEFVRRGMVDVVNPFNCKQVTTASLSPAVVQCISWHEVLASYAVHYFNFTINGEKNSELEPHVDTLLDERLTQLGWLVAAFGPDAVNVRFDPIVFYRRIGRDGRVGDLVDNLEHFEKIIKAVGAFGVHTVSTKFVNHYAKSVRRMRSAGLVMENLSDEFRVSTLDRLFALAAGFGVELRICADQALSELTGTHTSSCVDAERINHLFAAKGLPPISVDKKDRPRRDGCHCTHTIDIGDYNTMPCDASCYYCYANPKR